MLMQVPEEEKIEKTKRKSTPCRLFTGARLQEIVENSHREELSKDIQAATRIARAMVTQYGMSDKFGLIGLASREDEQSQAEERCLTAATRRRQILTKK